MVSDVCEFFCWQVMSVKALGTSLKLTFEGNNQLVYPQTWFFMLVVAICVVMQMNYLNKVCHLVYCPHPSNCYLLVYK